MNTNSIYLTLAEKEKYALFLDITNVKWDELPVKKRISMARQVDYLIDDVNLKQVAALLGNIASVNVNGEAYKVEMEQG